MVKPVCPRIFSSQELHFSAVIFHWVSSNTASCPSSAIRPEVFFTSFISFFVGNWHLRKGKVYRGGNFSLFSSEEVPQGEQLPQTQITKCSTSHDIAKPQNCFYPHPFCWWHMPFTSRGMGQFRSTPWYDREAQREQLIGENAKQPFSASIYWAKAHLNWENHNDLLQLRVCLSLCLCYEKPQGTYVYFVGQTSRASCRNESLTRERAEGSPSRPNQGRHKQSHLQCQAGRDLDKSKDRDFLGLCMQHFRTVPVLWWAQIPSPPTQQTVEAEQSARRAFTTSLAAKR